MAPVTFLTILKVSFKSCYHKRNDPFLKLIPIQSLKEKWKAFHRNYILQFYLFFQVATKKLLKKNSHEITGDLMHKLSMIPSKNELDLMNDVDFVDKTEDPVLSE